MAERKDRMALLSRYTKLFNQKFQSKPSLNLNVEQWSADALIESYGLQYCYDLLAYYMDVAQNPNWKYFANFAHLIIEQRDQYQQDIVERKQRRELAKKWLSE